MFRVSEMTIRRWAASGRLPMLRLGHRILFHRDAVAKLLTPCGGRRR
jgi:excisionase family DNA binding protein